MPDADVRVARGEALPFDDQSFDAVLSQLVLNFVPDAGEAMAEMRPFPTGVGPAGRYAASLDADAQATLHDEFFRRLGEPQGPFTLSARAWCAVGRVHQPQGALSRPRPPT